jgi:hypothetical protein
MLHHIMKRGFPSLSKNQNFNLPLPNRYCTVPSPFWAKNKKLNELNRYRSYIKSSKKPKNALQF